MYWEINQNIDIRHGAQGVQVWPNALMITGDNQAHVWKIRLLEDGAAAAVSGTITGYFVRPDKNTVMVAGSLEGNVASVTLPQAVYAQAGNVQAIMRLSDAEGQVVTLSALILPVRAVLTDAIIDPGELIPSIDNLIAQIAAMEEATARANAAGFNLRGNYNPDADPLYAKHDMVYFNGGSYAYTNDTPSNELPTSATHWQQIASIGGQDLVDAAVAARNAAQGYKDAAAASAAQLAAGIGSPAKSYANLAALNEANPAHDRTYLTEDDWKIALWDETAGAFVAGGVYQAASVVVDIASINSQLAEIVTRHQHANLLNPSDADYAPNNYVNPSTGALASSSSYNTSGFIPVNAGDKIVLTTTMGIGRVLSTIPWICGYNASKVRVSGSGKDTVDYYVVPAGVSYIRISETKYSQPAVEVFTDRGISGVFLAYGSVVQTAISGVRNVEMYVPDNIHVAVGFPVDLYFRAMCPAYLGYRMTVTPGTGSHPAIQIKRDKIYVPATNVGSRLVLITVSDADGNVVAARATRIRVSAASTATKSILPIGDSLSTGKAWLAEMIKQNGNISFVGSTSFSIADSGGTTRTGKHQGISGISAKGYMTSASSNPFWDATKNAGAGGFSYSYYVHNTLADVAPDIALVFLGMNDASDEPELNAGYIKQMVDSIRADAATLPIIVVTPQYRSFYGEAGYAITSFRLMQEVHDLLLAYANTYIVPLGLMHDSENNYVSGTEAVNPRATITQPANPDTVHPPVPGIYQFADAIFGTFSRNFTA